MRLLTAKTAIGRLARFAWRVLKQFSRNKGLLLAGAVAYNTLLSVIPLIAVVLVILTGYFDEDRLLPLLTEELQMLAPGSGELLADEIRAFIAHRELFGGLGLVVLLFFSSLAFRMLEDSMAVIFARARHQVRRPAMVSVLLPYAYILFVGFGILALSSLAALVESVSEGKIEIFGFSWQLAAAPGVMVYIGGLIGEVLLFASIYRVMPMARVRFRLAIVGGVIATALWEVTRHVLIWWFGSISLVGKVYGSLATVVIILLTMEVAAIILLLGAQAIAEIERSAQAGVHWHEEPAENDEGFRLP